MFSRRPARPLLLAGAALALIPAAALAATPKKFGFYYSMNSKSQESVTLGVDKHKIANGSATLRFVKGGKLCAVPGASVASPIGVSFNIAKHPITPSRSGSFSFKTVNVSSAPRRAPITVSGKFISSKSAKITVKSSFNGCKGSYSTGKTKFTLGG